MAKRNILILLAIVSLILLSCCKEPDVPGQVNINGKKYSLVLSDDFEFWDTDLWLRCPQIERQDAGGWWKNKCSDVIDGNMVITCSIDNNGTPISGAVRTRPKHNQTFGVYHIRFKMEKADGLWYAFWLLCDEMENDTTGGNGAVDGAELDILEVVPGPGEFAMSVHWDGYGDNLKSYSDWIYVSDDFYDRYHEIWYVWDQNGYSLYLDGTDSGSRVFSISAKQHGIGACSVPCYLIISAEYGEWGGEIVPEQLPAHLYVDYVEIYSESENGK